MNELLDTALIKKVSTFIAFPDDQNWCTTCLVRDIILAFNFSLLVSTGTTDRAWVLSTSSNLRTVLLVVGAHQIKHRTVCRYKVQPLFRTF